MKLLFVCLGFFFWSAFYGVLLNQHNGYPSIVLFITVVSNLLFTRLSPLPDYEYKKRGPVFYLSLFIQDPPWCLKHSNHLVFVEQHPRPPASLLTSIQELPAYQNTLSIKNAIFGDIKEADCLDIQRLYCIPRFRSAYHNEN